MDIILTNPEPMQEVQLESIKTLMRGWPMPINL